MKLLKRLNDAAFLFRVLRVATVLVGLMGTLFALILADFGLFALKDRPFNRVNVAAGAGLLTVVVVGACCYAALVSFFRMCGRLEHSSAFTDANAAAMARIARALFAGGVCAAAGIAAVSALWEVDLLLIYLSFIPLALLGAALLSHALVVLMRRAVALQQDRDLTI